MPVPDPVKIIHASSLSPYLHGIARICLLYKTKRCECEAYNFTKYEVKYWQRSRAGVRDIGGGGGAKVSSMLAAHQLGKINLQQINVSQLANACWLEVSA